MTTKKILLSIFILILTIKLSLGMGYGFTEKAFVTYEPGFTKTFNYTIIPTSSETMNYTITKEEGYLSEYVIVNPSENLIGVNSEENPSLNITVNFPEEILKDIKPGLHEVFVQIAENTESGGMFNVRSAARIKTKILVLYEDKYLTQPQISIPAINEGQNASVNIKVSNYGKKNIDLVYANIKIYDQNNLIENFLTNKISLKSEENKEITGKSTVFLNNGDYKVIATIIWDNQTTNLESSLKVGSLDIKINKFTSEVEKDSINEFSVDIESFWNNKLDNVYAIISIGDNEIKTSSISLESWQKSKLTGYLNTNNLKEGEQNIIIKIYHNNQEITQKEGKIKILYKEKTTKEEIIKNNVSYNMMIALVIVAMILIGINVFWITRKKNWKSKK